MNARGVHALHGPEFQKREGEAEPPNPLLSEQHWTLRTKFDGQRNSQEQRRAKYKDRHASQYIHGSFQRTTELPRLILREQVGIKFRVGQRAESTFLPILREEVKRETDLADELCAQPGTE